jgi:hypothetical protein
MKHISVLFSLVVLGSMLLAACTAPAQLPAEPGQPEAPAATESQPSEPPAAAPTESQPSEPPAAAPTASAPEPAPTAAPAAAQPQGAPGEMPSGDGYVMGDQSTVSSLSPGRALVGDHFNENKFERPYNANTQDVYFPNLDIVSGNAYEEGDWVYARLTMVGRDANNAFPGQFALEVDPELDGRGNFLVLATNPSSGDWTTDGVQVLLDSNGDVGGAKVLISDTAGSSGDGYDTDAGADLAWVRLSPTDPNSIEMAFKASLLQGDDKFQMGFWAATNALNPALFDLNDHYTHEQAGAALDEYEAYYPIKALAELDNSCRVAVGFLPSSPLLAGCEGQ